MRSFDEELKVLLKKASAQSVTQALGLRYRNNNSKTLNIQNDEIKTVAEDKKATYNKYI
jgi:hypothetical protein